jgi:pimeloyl-ACP methyl ester carboxylesterase
MTKHKTRLGRDWTVFMPRWVRSWWVRVLVVLMVPVLALVVALYTWPVQDATLRRADRGHAETFQQSQQSFAAVQRYEGQHLQLRPGCGSRLMQHGHRTARAVVMFHGYTACPSQFTALATYFYDHGYNVYVPRAPYHGLTDQRAHSHVSAKGLVGYADRAVTLGSGLGDEVGVVGLSGGGVEATWSARYRSDVVRRALVLSPFYQPSASRAPAWQVHPFLLLYGHDIVGDRWSSDGFSYRALAKYVLVAQNITGRPQPPPLSVALVYSTGDHEIDTGQARAVIGRLSPDPLIYVPPARWGVGHDIVDPKEGDTNGHAADLFPRYLALYEGRADHTIQPHLGDHAAFPRSSS